MKKKIIFAIVLLALFSVGLWLSKTGVKATYIRSLITKLAAPRDEGVLAYPPPPATLEITDSEINTGVRLLCSAEQMISFGQKFGLFKGEKAPLRANETLPYCQFFEDLKITFEDGKYLARARLFQPVKGQASLEGKISLVGTRNIWLDFSNVSLNGQLASADTINLMEYTANLALNGILDQMRTVSIQSIKITPGKITIKGILSVDEIFCLLGVKIYCQPTVAF